MKGYLISYRTGEVLAEVLNARGKGREVRYFIDKSIDGCPVNSKYCKLSFAKKYDKPRECDIAIENDYFGKDSDYYQIVE